MRPGPKVAADRILSESQLDRPPTDVVDAVVEIILEAGWQTSHAEAAEDAERWRDRVLQRLRDRVSQAANTGPPCRVTFNSSSEHFIQGACFIEPHDGETTRDRKRRRLQSDRYTQAMAELTPEEFEGLCGRLIELIGVTSPQVTRRAADEGIDFFGKVEMGAIFFPEDLSPTIQPQLDIWLVGQAKHYKSMQTGTADIRELAGSVALARSSTFGSRTPPHPDLAIRVADPVFAVYVTTGQISANGWRLLERSGIVGLDGPHLAAFLADRNAGPFGAEDEFDEERFKEWVRGSEISATSSGNSAGELEQK